MERIKEIMNNEDGDDKNEIQSLHLTFRCRRCDNERKVETISMIMRSDSTSPDRKLTLFVSQFRKGNMAYFRTIETARDETMLKDYVQILIEIHHTCGVTVSVASRETRKTSYRSKLLNTNKSLMLAGNEFQSLGRAIVKEDEYEEMRWDGIVSIVSWRERVFRLWWEESSAVQVRNGTYITNICNLSSERPCIRLEDNRNIPEVTIVGNYTVTYKMFRITVSKLWKQLVNPGFKISQESIFKLYQNFNHKTESNGLSKQGTRKNEDNQGQNDGIIECFEKTGVKLVEQISIVNNPFSKVNDLQEI
ncbi:hypothetical protein ANN_22142 [Periplaneta americana]|uniref:PiggyBac transposable element-derived protein domain-containing protein n=1 Tax=Periplaneta americana TaxID=6978 RepID=A0ABQ8S7M6_PERAM|nr:hypothetical protein ANN_22142 [Periplaneta americana]